MACTEVEYDLLLQRMSEAEHYFIGTCYDSQTRNALTCFLCNDLEGARKYLSGLPTKDDLLNDLVEKLVKCKKSIARTLKKIQNDTFQINIACMELSERTFPFKSFSRP